MDALEAALDDINYDVGIDSQPNAPSLSTASTSTAASSTSASPTSPSAPAASSASISTESSAAAIVAATSAAPVERHYRLGRKQPVTNAGAHAPIEPEVTFDQLDAMWGRRFGVPGSQC